MIFSGNNHSHILAWSVLWSEVCFTECFTSFKMSLIGRCFVNCALIGWGKNKVIWPRSSDLSGIIYMPIRTSNSPEITPDTVWYVTVISHYQLVPISGLSFFFFFTCLSVPVRVFDKIIKMAAVYHKWIIIDLIVLILYFSP